jgi:tripartite-type tricarboxylate transporter receptor subunit TctC
MPAFRATMLIAGLVACAMPMAPALAQQDYPTKVIQIVNPYPPGSTTDILVRGLAPGLSSRLGQQAVVINRPGAGGAIGTASVARAAPDGYTLLFAPALVVSVLPAAREDTGYKPEALQPVCQTFSNAMALAVRQESPLKSVKDLVQAAREKPGKLNYGHQGPSTIPHLAMEEFLEAAKLQITGVPYRGEPPVITDLLGGRIELASIVLGSAMVHRDKVRLLGIFAEERHPAFPDVPTVKEQGFPVSPTSFGGILAPAGTPPAIITKLEEACAGAAKDEAYLTAAKAAAQPKNYYADRATFARQLQHDVEVKRRLLARLGAQPETR